MNGHCPYCGYCPTCGRANHQNGNWRQPQYYPGSTARAGQVPPQTSGLMSHPHPPVDDQGCNQQTLESSQSLKEQIHGRQNG